MGLLGYCLVWFLALCGFTQGFPTLEEYFWEYWSSGVGLVSVVVGEECYFQIEGPRPVYSRSQGEVAGVVYRLGYTPLGYPEAFC